jgi:hypothetical protein
MTNSGDVAPAITGRAPDTAAASQRVADIARAHASIVSTDWYDAKDALKLELDRG